MQDYEQICKHVGKMVLDFHFDLEKISSQFKTAMEEFKKTIDEKNSRIKNLESDLELARSKK